jgi:hypothetical protein
MTKPEQLGFGFDAMLHEQELPGLTSLLLILHHAVNKQPQ